MEIAILVIALWLIGDGIFTACVFFACGETQGDVFVSMFLIGLVTWPITLAMTLYDYINVKRMEKKWRNGTK